MQQVFYDLIPSEIPAERMCLEDVTLVVLALSWDVALKGLDLFTQFFLNRELLAKTMRVVLLCINAISSFLSSLLQLDQT